VDIIRKFCYFNIIYLRNLAFTFKMLGKREEDGITDMECEPSRLEKFPFCGDSEYNWTQRK
jgi:hypothetical protein